MNPVTEEILMHYGMPRRSGRYPWGSGEDPYQRTRDFLGRIEEYQKKGMSEVEIAKAMNILDKNGKPSTGKLRTQKRLAINDRKILQIQTAERLRDKEGLGWTEIGRRMDLPESTVRSLLNPESKERAFKTRNIANFLKEQVDGRGMIDVGAGTENQLKISKENLNAALTLLEMDGYPTYGGRVDQVTNAGQKTTLRILCPPGTQHKEIYDLDRLNGLYEYTSHDSGETFSKFVYPKSMDSSRMMVRYKEDGGIDKDGIVEIRRGVPDLSLGDSHYSQVRILVDGTHYIKGMAVYSDDMPPGVDLVFNTNKGKDKSLKEVLKEIKPDPDNPFGSLIKPNGQSYYEDEHGNKQLSLINKRADQGDWTEWKDTLPSQFLGKQNLDLVKKQLKLAKDDKIAEFEDICALDNPTVKKYYLEKFADECDSAAVHLKAAALPGQKYHVIVPVNTLKETEVYAPQYDNGTKLALVRYPHGGTFEIPILTVNNKNKLADSIIGKSSIDAIGITKANADRLSGADFDGDTVMAIPTHDPNNKIKITSTRQLKGLIDYDPKDMYGAHEVREDDKGVKHYYQNGVEYPILSKARTQNEMGVVSNLITDMTLVGARTDDIAKAVRHSMTVIDANKHHLNYKKSEIDNEIARLKREYQISVNEDGTLKYGGASTILSRAKSQTSVEKRQGSPIIDPETGKVSYKRADDLYYPDRKYDKDTGEMTIRLESGGKIKYNVKNDEDRNRYNPVKRVDPDTGEITYTDSTGTLKYKRNTRMQESTKMMEVDDANTLVSKFRNPKELEYANYANDMKAMANRARKEMVTTKETDYSSSAKNAYAKEVSSLNAKLNEALKNAPKERLAQIKANAEIDKKKAAYKETHDGKDMPSGDLKKLKQQTLSKYRTEVGSIARRDRSIEITDREWEAIQAGAISKSQLRKILNNTDADNLRQRAMPRTTTQLTTAKVNRIRSLSASNYSLQEIASKLGVSTATIAKYLKGKE